MTGFLSDDVWITRCCTASCNTFVCVFLRQKNTGRERRRKCVFKTVYNQWHSLMKPFFSLSSSLSPSHLLDSDMDECHFVIAPLSHSRYSSVLSGVVISILLRSVRICRVGRLNVRSVLQWRAFGWRVERSQPFRNAGGISPSARPAPKTHSWFRVDGRTVIFYTSRIISRFDSLKYAFTSLILYIWGYLSIQWQEKLTNIM